MTHSRNAGRARTLLLSGLAVAVVAGLGAATVIYRQSQVDAPTAKSTLSQEQLVARGRAVALASDCVACHTSNPALPFAGGVSFFTPFGKLYSTNITQDKVNGIGSFSDAEIISSVRNGISKDGRRLYPAMPYTSYTGMSDDDVVALVAYLRTIAPIDSKPPANTMGFPFNQRWAMAFWNVVNFSAGRQLPVASKTPEWNRGAYLVQTLEHCQECHSPRNLLQGLTGPKLSGGDLGAWQAYNITSSTTSGIGGWSDDELFSYLKNGIAPGKANAAGPMAEAIEHSLSHLDDSDIHAMVTYLREVPAAESKNAGKSRHDYGQAYTGTTALRASHPQYDPSSDAISPQVLFNANCATCHGPTGKGVGDYPRLFGNTVLGASSPTNVTSVILNGVRRTVNGDEVFMPAFRNLSDAQVAGLSNFLFKQFGNPDAQLTAAEVKKLR